ncbi:LPXTG cell wall anchor domain-containing protein [Bacteroidales bacterium OttesenSCG-928-C03]|nr:LPXTG cell wall anchor domain-containing protein [Bacteroidales bacterium OttesenSCG-928-C03]MDL2326746.1 LPXTG cell wall anchor domain-containing protein [Bacteroidales bacterium OttesenSCG-928-A14]
MKHVIQIKRDYGKPRKHRISDVDYNNMVGMITDVEARSAYPKHFRIYATSPSGLAQILKSYITGVSDWDVRAKYIRLGFNSKAARNSALDQVEAIRNGKKIIGYDANDPLLAITENGTKVRLTSAMNAPSGSVGSGLSNLVSPVNKSGSETEGENKTLIIIAIVALVAIIGFVIFKKKKK